MPSYLLLFLLFLKFLSSAEWPNFFTAIVDHDSRLEFKDLSSEGAFEFVMKKAIQKYPQLQEMNFPNWSSLAQSILSLAPDKPTRTPVPGLGQPVPQVTAEWVFPFRNFLRFGNFTGQVPVDLGAVYWDPTDQDDQIMKLDILFNLKNNLTFEELSRHFKFTKGTEHFLTALKPVEGVVQQTCELTGLEDFLDLKKFALMFGDGFIDDEFDPDGNKLEGGDPSECACLIAKLLQRVEDMVSKFKDFSEFDVKLLGDIKEGIRYSVTINNALKNCKGLQKPYELFEDIIISLIRDMPDNKSYFFNTGFTQHAMLVRISKAGTKYTICVYNSGAGIEFHNFKVKGKHEKFIPLLGFGSVPLYRLKSLGFFRKLAEIYGTSNYGLEALDAGSLKAFDQNAMYRSVLSILHPFEAPAKHIETFISNLVTTQRSGVCAFLCIMVYLATKFKNFRLLKLLMSKVALDVALSKDEFKPTASPAARRLVKFALENYARSVEKFAKKENIQARWSLEIFGDDKFWEKHAEYAKVWPIAKAKKFEFNTALYDSVVLSGIPALDPYSNQIAAAFEAQQTFEEAYLVSPSPPLSVFPLYGELMAKAMAKLNSANFMDHLDALINLATHNWLGTPDSSKLAFFTSTIIYRWPCPTFEHDLYNEVFYEAHDYIENQQKLFKLVTKIIHLMYSDMKWYPQIRFAIAKVTAIYHKIMVHIHEPFKKCFTDEYLMINLATFESVMFDSSIYSQGEKLDELFLPEDGRVCFNTLSAKIVHGPGNVITEYLKGFITQRNMSYTGTLESKITELFSKRSKKFLPSTLYFWRDMSLIVSNLKAHTEGVTLHYGIPFIDQNKIHDPMTSSDFVKHERGDANSGCLNRIYSKKSDIWTDECVLNTMIDTSSQNSIFNTGNMPIRRYLNASKSTNLKTNVTDSFFFMNRSGALRPERGFVAFLNMLDECKSHISFNNFMKLGHRVIDLIESRQNEDESKKVLLDTLLRHLRYDLDSMEKMQDQLMDKKNIIPDVSSLAERTTAILLLSGYVASITACKEEHLDALRKSRKIYYKLCSLDGNPEYLAIMQLGFLASFRAGHDTVFDQEDSIMILVLNQKFATISRALSDHLRIAALRFSVKMNVAHAVYSFYSTCQSVEDTKVLSSLPIDRKQFKAFFPWLAINREVLIDLLSGTVFKGASRVSTFVDEEVKATFHLAQMDPEKYEITEITTSIRGLKTLTVYEFKPGTKFHVEEAKTVTDVLMGRHNVVRLEVIKYGYLSHRILFNNGQYAYLQRDQRNDIWSSLPIPAAHRKDIPYLIWVFPATREVAFDSDAGCIWAKEGLTSFMKERLSDLRHIPWIDKRIDPYFPRSGFPLSSTKNTALFYRSENGNAELYLLFKKLTDLEGNRLIFYHKCNDGTRWIYKNNENYSVSPDQEFINCGFIKNSLVLQNDFHKKVFIPLSHTLVSTDNLKGIHKDPTQQIKCVFISLNENNVLDPKSQLQFLVLAYHYLIARNYLLSMEALTRIHHMEGFVDEELRVLGWIVQSGTDNHDGSPESTSVRNYAAFLVFANANLHGKGYTITSEMNAISDVLPSPYADGLDWRAQWSRFVNKKTEDPVIYRTAKRYYRVRSKVPLSLRCDSGARRQLMTKFEEQKWLELLGVNLLDSDLDNEFYLTDEMTQILPTTQLDYPAMRRHLLSGNYQIECSLDLNKVSWVYPEVICTKFPLILVEMLFKDMSHAEKLRYMDFFVGLRNSAFTVYAKVLYDSLATTNIRNIWRNYVETGENIQQIYVALKTAVWRTKIGKIKKLPVKFRSFEISEVEETISMDYEIVTKNLKDFDGTKEVDMASLKSSGDVGLLNATLEKLLTYRKTIAGALSKATGLVNTRKRRLVAKGKFILVRPDFFRLYVQASPSFYSQMLPDLVSPEEYQTLHDLITEYILLLTNINDIKRMIAAYKTNDTNEIKKEIARRRYTSTQDRIPLTYEFFINSRLDEQQLSDFNALMKIGKDKATPKLIQRIMSAGKTYVYGTCLAVGHADGEHLSILVLPKSLYTSEAASIINRTMSAFSFDGFSFQISRDSDITKPSTLEWIYRSLLKAIKMRKYLIMPPETLLVLQNLFFENSMASENNPNYDILKKICSVLKNKGVITFDEVDTLFEPTHELNFSVSNSIQSDENADLLRLQGYLIGEMFYCLLSPEIRAIQDVTLNKLITEEDYARIRPLLARKMAQKLIKQDFILDVLGNPRMPAGLFNGFDENMLTLFFDLEPMQLGPYRSVFTEIQGIQLTLLALCRLAIQDWIYMSWSGNVNENYGVSPDPEVLYAIPYLGAGNPKVDSEFSFRWYAYARTFRMYMVLGFGKPAFEKSLAWIKKKILLDEASSRSEELLRSLFDVGPYGLNLKSNEQISGLFEVVDNFHKRRNGGDTYYIYLFDWIASDLLPSISFFLQQISSNCQDIPMMVKSFCAYSGTVPSTKQLPPMMHKERYVDLKDDITERIKEAVLRNSPPEVLVVPTGLTSKQLFDMIKPTIEEYESSGSPFSAVIDAGAYFKDESNESVAETLLNFKDAVIFYGTEGKGKNKPSVSTKIEKSRLIPDASRTGIQHLGYADVNRVTYFDQQHVVGTDIHHNPKGFAVVIVGVKTSSRDFYQAVMRMRMLLQDQRLLVVVPRDAYAAISSLHGKETPNLIGCLQYMEHNLNVRMKKLNLMSLFKIIRAQFREAVYERLLAVSGSRCPEVGLWLKETEAKIELLAMPQSERSTFKLVQQFAEHLSSISQPYIEPERFIQVIKKVKRIIERAKMTAEDYEPTMTVFSADGEPAKNEDIMGVGEQMMEHQIEAAKLVDLEVESTTSNGFSVRTFSTPFILDFSVPDFPEVPDYSIHSTSLEPGLLCLDKFFKANPAFALLSGVFDERIYISKSFTDVFFGKMRNLIFDVVVLAKMTGGVRDMRLLIISSNEANAFTKYAATHVFGYTAQLLSPSEHSDIDLVNLNVYLDEYRQVMAEIMIFGGYYNKLSEPEWLRRFERWLGDGQTRLLKSAIFREIILDELEWKDAVRSRLPITTACLHQVSPYDHLNLIETPDFIVLNFLCRKKYPIIEFYERAASKLSLQKFEMVLANTESVFKLDDEGLIISSVLPKLMWEYSTMQLTPSMQVESCEKIRELALGLSLCPKKLINVIEWAVNYFDLSLEQMDAAVSALSEALGIIMIKQRGIVEEVSAMIRRFAQSKVFNKHPNSVSCLYGMLSPYYDGAMALSLIFQNFSPDERKNPEWLFWTHSPTVPVQKSIYEAEFETALHIQRRDNFPNLAVSDTVNRFGKPYLAAPILLQFCRTKASIGRAVLILFSLKSAQDQVIEILSRDYRDRTDEDGPEFKERTMDEAKQFVLEAMTNPSATEQFVDNNMEWSYDEVEETNKRFKTGP